MRDALRGGEGQFGVWKQIHDLLQVLPRRFAILREFQMPVR